MAVIEDSDWDYLQEHLGYSDDEMVLFKENPRNVELIVKGSEMLPKEIVFEFVETHGCFSHNNGERLYFDPLGNLIVSKCPERVCSHAIQAGLTHLFAAGELLFHGVDPNNMRFKRFGCMDVGLRCGGWGHAVMEIMIVDDDQ